MPPAKGCFFVPGSMIIKSERLAEAFARLVKNETDHAARFEDARLVGVFEHFYTTNRSASAGYGTHYGVLGYEYRWPPALVPKPDDQHSELRWWSPSYWFRTACMKTPRPISATARAMTRRATRALSLDDDLGRGTT